MLRETGFLGLSEWALGGQVGLCVRRLGSGGHFSGKTGRACAKVQRHESRMLSGSHGAVHCDWRVGSTWGSWAVLMVWISAVVGGQDPSDPRPLGSGLVMVGASLP